MSTRSADTSGISGVSAGTMQMVPPLTGSFQRRGGPQATRPRDRSWFPRCRRNRGGIARARYRPGVVPRTQAVGRVAPAYWLCSGEIFTTSPLVGAWTILPSPMYMPMWDTGE